MSCNKNPIYKYLNSPIKFMLVSKRNSKLKSLMIVVLWNWFQHTKIIGILIIRNNNTHILIVWNKWVHFLQYVFKWFPISYVYFSFIWRDRVAVYYDDNNMWTALSLHLTKFSVKPFTKKSKLIKRNITLQA